MRPLAAAAVVFAALPAFPALLATAGEREVTAGETPVRSAPFDVAPEIARVRAGDRLPADDQPQGIWRRVQLQDGRYGFVHDADAREAPPIPVAAPAADSAAVHANGRPALAPAATTTAAAVPVARVQAAPVDDSPKAGPTLLGVIFEILPVGKFRATERDGMAESNASGDSAFAVAVAPSIDFPASPYFAFGLSPKVIFRVRGEGSSSPSSTEYDLRARLTARAPLSPTTRVYGRLSPGYSIISLPAPAANVLPSEDPTGFVCDVSVGVEVALLPRLFAVIDLGYQMGFQSRTNAAATFTFEGSQYLHLGGGLTVGF